MESIQSTFEYINKYGFVQVAVHDESFFSASKRALSFLKYKGLTALMNDSIVATLGHLGAISGGLLAGLVPEVLAEKHAEAYAAMIEPWEAVYGQDSSTRPPP